MNSTVPSLIRSLGSPDPHERAHAATVLGEQQVAGALENLRCLLEDHEPVVGLAAMFACWKLGDDCLSMDRLQSALNSDDEAVVQQAVHTVSAIGTPLISQLTPMLDRSPDDAVLALRLLEEIGGQEALKAIQAVKHPDQKVSQRVTEILEDWEDEPRKESP